MKKLHRILIIDDDKISQLLYKRVLENSGVAEQVISYLKAEDSLKYLSEGSSDKEKLPELIFLDINMPGMDGWDYLNAFEKLGEEVKNKVKIAMLTSSVDPEDKVKASAYKEVIDFVEKPLTSERAGEMAEKYFQSIEDATSRT